MVPNANTPVVSVIIPVFSRASTIGRAIASVTAQTYGDYEIIVVDDASTDDTVARVEALGLSNLSLLRHEANRGAAAARNTGIKAARGRWIAFLDSDDVWTSEEKLALQLAALQTAGPRILACATGYGLSKDGQTREVRLDWSVGEFQSQILYGCSISPGATLMVDRKAFDDIGLFDEHLRRFEDWDWLLRYASKYDMTFVPAPLAEVFLDQPPSAQLADASALAALERIQAKHLPRLTSRADRQRLLSSLLVERAAIHYRKGRVGLAVKIVVAALLHYPFRNAAFFRAVFRSFVSLFR